MVKTLKTIIQLRRDNDYNYEKVKDTVLLNGEIWLVDTSRDGLRAKVGDGVHTYAQLDFEDTQYVRRGYYDKDNTKKFYYENSYTNEMEASTNSIYIDASRSKIYYYDGAYISIDDMLPTATAEIAGVAKLYSTTGQNTDGAMSQKAITDELNKKVEASVNTDDEMLILSISL